jgi:hypothetical protein
MTMEAKSMKAIPHTEEVRMTGGRMGDRALIRHAYTRGAPYASKYIDKVMPHLPQAKHRLADILK